MGYFVNYATQKLIREDTCTLNAHTHLLMQKHFLLITHKNSNTTSTPLHTQALSGVLAQSCAPCAVGRRGGSNKPWSWDFQLNSSSGPWHSPLALIINQPLRDQRAPEPTYKDWWPNTAFCPTVWLRKKNTCQIKFLKWLSHAKWCPLATWYHSLLSMTLPFLCLLQYMEMVCRHIRHIIVKIMINHNII